MTSLGEMGGRTILLITFLAALVSSIVVAIISRFISDDIFRRNVLVYGSGVRAQSIAALVAPEGTLLVLAALFVQLRGLWPRSRLTHYR